MALITKNQAYFYIDSRYIEAAKRSISGAVVELTDLKTTYYDRINAVLDNEGIKSLGIEEGIMSHAEFLQARGRLKAELVPAQDMLAELRTAKSAEEIEKLTTAQRIAERAYDQTLDVIRIGMTEKEIAAELIYRMLREGAEGLAFDPIVVSGLRTSLPHGVPSEAELREGCFLTLDFGCKYDGYCSDMTRTVAFGFVSEEMLLVYDTVLEAQTAAISGLKAGMTGAEADGLARAVIERAGYGEYFGHGFGHGVGLDVHEAPTANPSGMKPMPAGTVISAEPGIYLPGRFGVRIEDVVVLIEGGCVNLTRTPKKLLIL
jgi:Xaa-Pro aminopeptidase